MISIEYIKELLRESEIEYITKRIGMNQELLINNSMITISDPNITEPPQVDLTIDNHTERMKPLHAVFKILRTMSTRELTIVDIVECGNYGEARAYFNDDSYIVLPLVLRVKEALTDGGIKAFDEFGELSTRETLLRLSYAYDRLYSNAYSEYKITENQIIDGSNRY